MSRVTITGSTRDPKRDWNEMDVDEIVDQLTPGEIQSLLDECDPDDPHIHLEDFVFHPASVGQNFRLILVDFF
jgi:hypothetical protein